MLIPYVVEARYAYMDACMHTVACILVIHLKSVGEKMGITKSCLQPLPHPIMNLIWPPILTGWRAKCNTICFQWLGNVTYLIWLPSFRNKGIRVRQGIASDMFRKLCTRLLSH